MKFREFTTSSGKKVLAGKDAEQNEELIKQFIGKDNKIFHTAAPGSPFCVIEKIKHGKKDEQETAIFCASKSQNWRDNKGDVEVNFFSGEDIYKDKSMKIGTFGVRKFRTIIATKKEIEKLISKTIKTK
jgi:predicted ribosome quality control (RQC) complex YloA/Tae2 family protein